MKKSDKELRTLKSQEPESKADEQIKTNIVSHLAEKLRDLTLDFKSNEKEHFLKLKEFHGDDEPNQRQQQDDLFFQ